MSFKATVSLVILCMEDLTIDNNGVLKSPTLTVLLSISYFMSIKILFIYLGVPLLSTWNIFLHFFTFNLCVCIFWSEVGLFF